MTAAQVADWTALGARFVTVRSTFSTNDDPDVVIDVTGALTAWMKRFGARVLVVRPDRFVAATDATGAAGLDVPPPRGNLTPTPALTKRHATTPTRIPA